MRLQLRVRRAPGEQVQLAPPEEAQEEQQVLLPLERAEPVGPEALPGLPESGQPAQGERRQLQALALPPRSSRLTM